MDYIVSELENINFKFNDNTHTKLTYLELASIIGTIHTMIETDVTGRAMAVGVDTKITGDAYFTPLGQNTALMAKLNEIRADVVSQSQCLRF